MREWFVVLTEGMILVIDMMALLVVACGATEAFLRAMPMVFTAPDETRRRDVWLRFMRLLVAGLTFQLAADIIETSITTTWEALGRIAAIAVVRTFLNFFLERDLADAQDKATAAARGK